MHHEYHFCFGDERSHDYVHSRAIQHQMTYASFLQHTNLGYQNNLLHSRIRDIEYVLDIAGRIKTGFPGFRPGSTALDGCHRQS
jgi:hypothetical protein